MNRKQVRILVGLIALAILLAWAGFLLNRSAPYPMNAVEFQGSHYHLYQERLSWQEAKARCEKLGGRLVVIPDQATQDFIAKLSKGQRVWLGAEMDALGNWIWVDGSPMTFTAWDHRQPDNYRSRETVLMMSINSGGWNDAWGARHRNTMGMPVVGFICEWPAMPRQDEVSP